MCVYYIGFKLRFLLFSNLISTRIYYYLMKNGYVERSNTTGEVARVDAICSGYSSISRD